MTQETNADLARPDFSRSYAGTMVTVLRKAQVFLVAALALMSMPAYADLPEPLSTPTENETRLLPEYCPDTQRFGRYGHNSPNAPKWVGLLGETFWALHHYCWGILKFNRSQMPGYPPEIRYGLKRSALGEFFFVTRLMPDNYVLAPEIYTYVGRTHLLLNELQQADEAFRKARKVRADYWPAYSWEASYLADHGANERARSIATEGLKHSPDSKTLQLIIRDLDSASATDNKPKRSSAR